MEKPSILKIKTLTAEWCDKDIILLHACFQLLTDFVENENAFTSHVDWENDELHKEAKREIQVLYNWWTTRKTLDCLDSINDLEKEQLEKIMQCLFD